jgi:integrase
MMPPSENTFGKRYKRIHNIMILLRVILKDACGAGLQAPYVFLNNCGRPVNQVSIRQVWVTAMRKSGLPFRRMYETRHTFASWALAAGESAEWVARTLGHVNTSYK